MKRELNKIFDVQSREARRDILDKFDLTSDDKNKVLNKIDIGGSSGSGSGENNGAIYYKIPAPVLLDSSSNSLLLNQNFFSAARGYFDTQSGYIYGTPSSIKSVIGTKYSSHGYIDAFEFRPIQYFKSNSDMTLTTYNNMESLNEAFPNLFGGVFPRITAEEYWAGYNVE